MNTADSFYIDIGKINIAHEFVLNKNNKCEYPNGRKYYGMVCCIDGEAEYVFNAHNRQTVQKGDVLFLSPNAAYSIAVKDEYRHYTVNFEIHAEFSNLAFLCDDFYLLRTENAKWYAHIFKELVTCRQAKKVGSEARATASLYELTALFAAEIYDREHTSTTRRLQPAKEYIEQNFNRHINQDMLANLCDMSVTHFRREWAKHYGGSALQYRDKIRLNYAKEYLGVGYYSVGEAAAKCGFDDVNYFVRFFKKHLGISPGKYKTLQ